MLVAGTAFLIRGSVFLVYIYYLFENRDGESGEKVLSQTREGLGNSGTLRGGDNSRQLAM